MDSGKKQYKGPERRKFPRFQFTNEFICNLIELEKIEGRVLDISAGGICLAIAEAIVEGSLISGYITLPGEAQKIRIKGKVVWFKNTGPLPDFMGFDLCYRAGIEFIEIDTDDRQRISRFVSQHLNKD